MLKIGIDTGNNNMKEVYVVEYLSWLIVMYYKVNSVYPTIVQNSGHREEEEERVFSQNLILF